MKRKIIAILLALCLFFTLSPPQKTEAASSVCFIATNDTLLDLDSPAYYQNSTLYIPGNVLAKSFRIFYTYYSSGLVATLYTTTKQIFFELDSGNTYDNDGEYYSTSAVMLNGQVYVSVSFICKQFGLSWSYINGSDSGDICRITDGNAVLSDSQFYSAASSLMTTRYNAYVGNSTEKVSPTPTIPDNHEEGNCDLYLSFQGMPSSLLLDTLKTHGITTTFFVTADEVRDAPDTVRRIIGEGHGIGVLCTSDPAEEFEDTAALIFEAARVNTVLISSASSEADALCKRAAAENDLVFWDYEIDGVRNGAGISYASFVTAYLTFYVERADMRLQCCEATDSCISSVLNYINKNHFNLRSVCEVGSPADR